MERHGGIERPDGFTVTFDESLINFAIDESEADLDTSWYHIYRSARKTLNPFQSLDGLCGVQVVPYTVEESVAFGIALVGYSIDESTGFIEQEDPVMMRINQGEGRCELSHAFDENSTTIIVSLEMSQHLMRMADAYIQLIESDSVVSPSTRSL